VLSELALPLAKQLLSKLGYVGTVPLWTSAMMNLRPHCINGKTLWSSVSAFKNPTLCDDSADSEVVEGRLWRCDSLQRQDAGRVLAAGSIPCNQPL